MNLLDESNEQPTKFRTTNWVEVNDDARGTYDANTQIKFKTTMLMSKLCDFSDAYIRVRGKVTAAGVAADAQATFAFKNCAPFTSCIT